jgi:hypothetical protein
MPFEQENLESSFDFRFTKNGKTYCLAIDSLYSEIEEITYLKKSDKFVLKLKKKTESSWYQLKKST